MIVRIKEDYLRKKYEFSVNKKISKITVMNRDLFGSSKKEQVLVFSAKTKNWNRAAVLEKFILRSKKSFLDLSLRIFTFRIIFKSISAISAGTMIIFWKLEN